MSDPPKPAAVTVPKCPVCQTELTRHGLVLCQKCSTPHHRQCWTFNKGCGVFGCGCRVLVLPPVAAGHPEVDKRLVFSRQLGYLDDRSGGMMALLVIALFFTHMSWIFPVVLAFLLPALMSVEHTVNPETMMLEWCLKLGGLPLLWRSRYRSLAEAQGIELRRRRAGPKPDSKGRGSWEIWLRDGSQGEVLLEVTKRRSMDEVLERLEFPIEQMDTVVSLPRGEGEAAALPAGLEDTLDGLPDDGL